MRGLLTVAVDWTAPCGKCGARLCDHRPVALRPELVRKVCWAEPLPGGAYWRGFLARARRSDRRLVAG